jgi:alkylmercury lyase
VSVPPLDEIAAAVIAAFPRLLPPEQRVSLAVYQLLAKGQPASAEQISAAAGVSRNDVGEMLARWHGVQRAPDGAVTAFWGLTLSKTKHRFRIEGRELHTWCAWDTLFLPSLLGSAGEVKSICPTSGEPVELKVGPLGIEAFHPASAVLSFLTPRESDVERNVIDSFCCHVHFFVSAEAGKAWVAEHSGTFLLSVADAWEVGVRKNSAQYHAVALRDSGRR